ncbi:hypothetical protein PYW07_009655 [Mythimna separata]|uniref:Uncharacterized protein n=1 Tax=Mythimna separata TaxID=271217 RepID=A0AAD7YCE1_MYTSE|nr:hypothetical protein PYW07_009655 [Mythimna separata]
MWLLCTFVLYLTIIGNVKSTLDFLQHPVKSCHVGDAVENACNKCLCTSKTVFECTPQDCNSNRTDTELEETEPVCVPNQLYVQNLITCICTKDGRWPHMSCKDTFQSLPPRNVITHSCEPDTYIPIDCNVCRCGPDGKILNDRCTRNACEDDIQRRTSYTPTNTVFSKCEDKYWYSLAPCQFCFCVNQNKLLCNTGNYYNRNLDLGSYKLNVCGKDLIKEAIELIPDSLRTLRTNQNNKTSENQRPLTHANSNNMAIEFVPIINSKKKPTQVIESVKINNNKGYHFAKVEPKTQHQEEKQTPHKSRPVHTTTTTEVIELVNINNNKDYPSDDLEAENQHQEEKPTPNPTNNEQHSTRGIPVARFHIKKNGEKADVNIVNGIEEDDDNSMGIPIEVEFEQSPPTRPKLRTRSDEKIVPYQYEGDTLRVNIPKALNKAFQIAVRKSMVTLSKTKNCTPGATTVHDCNMCFCLKNTKLLCTSHKCVGGKKA